MQGPRHDIHSPLLGYKATASYLSSLHIAIQLQPTLISDRGPHYLTPSKPGFTRMMYVLTCSSNKRTCFFRSHAELAVSTVANSVLSLALRRGERGARRSTLAEFFFAPFRVGLVHRRAAVCPISVNLLALLCWHPAVLIAAQCRRSKAAGARFHKKAETFLQLFHAHCNVVYCILYACLVPTWYVPVSLFWHSHLAPYTNPIQLSHT